MMMMPMRPEMIQNAHSAEPESKQARLCRQSARAAKKPIRQTRLLDA
jgi:hypothetical protein